MWRFGTLLVLALVEAGCVIGAERPPSRLELARAPSEPPSHDASALAERRGCPSVVPTTEEVPPPPSRDAVWIAGACHSTSVQYEWVPGHWEARPSPYSWK
jgi:hypothetical protein